MSNLTDFKVPPARALTAGNGLTGGGTLQADRTFTLGTPGTLTLATANAVTATSHTHELDLDLNLGTAANANLTTSQTDTTAGRVLKVGDFGLGGAVNTGSTDLDTIVKGGTYYHTEGDAPPNRPITRAGIFSVLEGLNDRITQLWAAPDTTNSSVFIRGRDSTGTWRPWREIYHTGNLSLGTAATEDDTKYAHRANNLSDVDASTARSNLNLGTAATANTTSNRSDTTVGRLLQVGDFGLGGTVIQINDGLSWNNVTVTGFYTGSGAVEDGPGWQGVYVTVLRYSTNFVAQTAEHRTPASGPPRQWRRVKHNGTWYPWREVYNQQSILGTVSQASGIPTGAIIERVNGGSNGDYVRYADGTQICVGPQITITDTAVTDDSGVRRSGASGRQTWTFPAAFSSFNEYAVHVSMEHGGGAAWRRFVFGRRVDSSSAEFSGYNINNEDISIQFRPIAIGRWY